MKIKLTDDGRNMLLNFVAGNKIKFTKAVFGNGDYRLAEGDKNLPRIINALKSCEFDSTPVIETEQSVAKLSATFDNSTVESGFHVTEVGYYAKLVTKNGSGEDVEGDEALYAIGNANSSEADYVPSKNERLVEVTYDGLEGAHLVRGKGTDHEERFDIDIDGFFLAIGHHPNTEVFRHAVECDEAGYIKVKHPTTATNIPGVFAAGDVADPLYRQAISAAGSGCHAAMDAERYLQAL